MASASWSVLIAAGSYVTWAVPTSTSCTVSASSDSRALRTAATQCSQCMPSISRVCCSVVLMGRKSARLNRRVVGYPPTLFTLPLFHSPRSQTAIGTCSTLGPRGHGAQRQCLQASTPSGQYRLINGKRTSCSPECPQHTIVLPFSNRSEPDSERSITW